MKQACDSRNTIIKGENRVNKYKDRRNKLFAVTM